METIKSPFVAFLFPLLLGILTGVYFDIHLNLIIYFFFLFPFFSYFFLEKKIFRYKSKFFGYFAYFFIFILGIFVVDIKSVDKPELVSEKSVFYQGIIVEQPKTKAKSIQAIIEIQSYKDSSEWKNFNARTIVYFSKDSIVENLDYGDRLVFQSRLNSIENSGNPNEFDYKSFMAQKNIFFTAFVKKKGVLILEHKQANMLIYNALKIRSKLMNVYKGFGIKNQKFAVLSALTLGYRDEVDKETRQMFADTGAMHILAVSGLHVGIIFMILSNLLAFMNKKKHLMIIKSIIIIFSLWLFATIAGLSPSVMRSALMFSLFVVGKILLRTSSIYNIIFASAFILLLINPFDIMSVGFQLSYAAVLAIVFFQPYIYKLFVFGRWLPDKLWALTSVSVAAQIGTMPIGLFYFHQFPNYFFITNVLVIPLASMILYVAVFLFAVSFVPYLNAAVAFVLKILLKWLIGGVTLIDSLPFATMKDIYISSLQMGLLYTIIICFTLFWIYNKRELLYSFFIAFIAFFIVDIRMNFINYSRSEVVIYNVKNELAINMINGKNKLIAPENVLSDDMILNYSLKPYWQKKRICGKKIQQLNLDSLLENDSVVNDIKSFKNALQVGNIRFYILRDSKFADYIIKDKLHVDYLILSNNVYIKIEEIKRLFDYKKIIFDSSNKDWRIKKWKEQCENLGEDYFDISNQGAFAVNIDTGEEIEF